MLSSSMALLHLWGKRALHSAGLAPANLVNCAIWHLTACPPAGPLQVNEGNIRTLTAELLAYLNVCDIEFKPDLTNKICMLVQRFAPDKRWYIDTLVQVRRGGRWGLGGSHAAGLEGEGGRRDLTP